MAYLQAIQTIQEQAFATCLETVFNKQSCFNLMPGAEQTPVFVQIPQSTISAIEALANYFNEHKQPPAVEVPAVTPPGETLLTKEQAAAFLQITLKTLTDWTKSGDVQGYRMRGRVYYKQSEILQSLQPIKTLK